MNGDAGCIGEFRSTDECSENVGLRNDADQLASIQNGYAATLLFEKDRCEVFNMIVGMRRGDRLGSDLIDRALGGGQTMCRIQLPYGTRRGFEEIAFGNKPNQLTIRIDQGSSANAAALERSHSILNRRFG